MKQKFEEAASMFAARYPDTHKPVLIDEKSGEFVFEKTVGKTKEVKKNSMLYKKFANYAEACGASVVDKCFVV